MNDTTHTNGRIEQSERQKAVLSPGEVDLRDYFATHCRELGDEVSTALATELAATQGVAKPTDSKDLMGWHRFWCAANAAHRYMMADAMLAARKAGTQQ